MEVKQNNKWNWRSGLVILLSWGLMSCATGSPERIDILVKESGLYIGDMKIEQETGWLDGDSNSDGGLNHGLSFRSGMSSGEDRECFLNKNDLFDDHI